MYALGGLNGLGEIISTISPICIVSNFSIVLSISLMLVVTNTEFLLTILTGSAFRLLFSWNW